MDKRSLWERQIKGKQSICFDYAPYIISSGCVVGKKEKEGPLGELFDESSEDELFGEKTWELAEGTMQQIACRRALNKAGEPAGQVRFL